MMRVIGVRISWSEENIRTLALKMPVIACVRISANPFSFVNTSDE